ncbi:MAG: hypothetical protein J1E64_00785 [Acetatifactor sp.]|nr:hypothetical protein [Acetatifactor sp.]
MKRGRRFTEKMVLAGVIAVTIMALCGCGAREKGRAVSLEDLRQEKEVQGEDVIAGNGTFSVDIEADVPEEVPEYDTLKGDIQEGNVRDKMEQMEEVEPSPATTKESSGEKVSTQVLLDRNDIAQVQIVNGSNGERITLTEGDHFEQILNYYDQLKIVSEGERNQIVGYTYSLIFYDSQSHELQTMVPRSGKVVLDGMVYVEDGSNVSSQLEQYITEHYMDIWGAQQICAYPPNMDEAENRPVCIEIQYPPENLD